MKKRLKCAIHCSFCNMLFFVPPYRGFSAKFCSRSCAGKANPIDQSKIKRHYGPNHFRWKKEGCKRKDGYILISINGKRFYEHRYIMEQHLSRKLKTSETIHHIDGNRANNILENLELLNRSDHTHKYHLKGKHF